MNQEQITGSRWSSEKRSYVSVELTKISEKNTIIAIILVAFGETEEAGDWQRNLAGKVLLQCRCGNNQL